MTHHTPIPWRIRPQELDERMRQIRYESGDGLASVIATTHNATICEEHGGDAVSNAAFIVRTVNCHEELLAALKEAREFVSSVVQDRESAMLGRIDQAIYKAESN